MIIVVKLLGILMICMGLVNLINPILMKKMISFWKQGKRIYAGGLLRVLFGVIFLLASSYSRVRQPCVLAVLGVLMILGGMLIFILGPEKMKAILGWWDKKPASILRLIAILALAIGTLVIYSA
ncbi:MAG: hypothetical protein PHQ57_05980 [Candidatus Omnitrophica bacterium]|nr:hypothetical protein [Candidatus Omnitrophota bacterium]